MLQAMGMGTGGIRPNRKEHAQGEMRLARHSPESKRRKAGEVSRDQARHGLDSEQAFCIPIVKTSTHLTIWTSFSPSAPQTQSLPSSAPSSALEGGFPQAVSASPVPLARIHGRGERVESLFLFTACLSS